MWHLPHISLRVASAIAVLVLIPAWKPGSILSSTMQAQDFKVDAAAIARLSSSYGKLPISFEVNQGQTDGSVQFLARGSGYTLFLTPGEAVLSLHAAHANANKPGGLAAASALEATTGKLDRTLSSSTVRLQLIGANRKAEVSGVDPLPGKSNYFVGSDPAKWHTDVPTYAKVRYGSVYPGIDLLYYGNQEGRLEHDFVVAPGADPNAIAIGLGNGDGVAPDKTGGLTLHTRTGDLTLQSPVVYQIIGGERKTIPATYLLADNQIKFQIGSYDRNETLVIDPVIQYSAVYGGTNIEYPAALAIDGSGNAYVSGMTESINFPVVHPVLTCESGVNGTEMAFVSKINAAGTALLYSSYLGSCSDSWSTGIGVDSGGRAYVVVFVSGSDSSLKVLSPAGDSVVYSSGIAGTEGTAITLDSSGNAYVASWDGGVVVEKFNSSGVPQYVHSVSITGYPNAIAVDASGSAYVAGTAYDPGFPITKNAYQTTCAAAVGFGCGFVTKLSPSGKDVVYSTYFGHPSVSLGMFVVGIEVDSSGNAYVAGSTGPGFPVTSNAFQKTYGGNGDGYVIKLNASGTGVMWSTYLGGSGVDLIRGLALDQYRQVYVSGYTNSPNFPLKATVQPATGAGTYQVFVTTLSGNLGSIVYYSTYLGSYVCGNANVQVALDKALNVYVGGPTCGGIKPTPGALTTGTPANPGGGDEDGFISKLVIMDDIALGVSASAGSVAQGGSLTYTIAVTSKGPDFGYNVRISDPLPVGTTFVSYDAGGGSCTAPAVGGTGTLNCEVLRLEKGDTYTVKLTVNVNAAAGTKLSNTATSVSNMQDFVPGNNTGTLTTMVN